MTDAFRLVMTKGPEPGQTIALDRDEMSIGRDPNSDITINDAQISRRHAQIAVRGNVVVLEDLGSTNGTFVNGMRLTTSQALSNGDVIGLGDVVALTFYGQTTSVEETVVAPQRAAPQPPPPEPEPQQPAPVAPAYPPPPAAAPAIAAAPPMEVEEPKPRRTGLWIALILLGLFIVGCVVVAALLWFAPESFWQQLIDMGIPVPSWPPF
jgi:predicted component of type VI protein secretion system